MSLSEKSGKLPSAPESNTKGGEQDSNEPSAKKSGGTLIERWDALQESDTKKTPRHDLTAENFPLRKAARQEIEAFEKEGLENASPRHEAAGDETLLQPPPKQEDAGQATAEIPATAQEPRRQAGQDEPPAAGPQPKANPRKGYSKVNYHMSYGPQTSRRRRVSKPEEAAASETDKPNADNGISEASTNRAAKDTARTGAAATAQATPGNKKEGPETAKKTDSHAPEESSAEKPADAAPANNDEPDQKPQPDRQLTTESDNADTGMDAESSGDIALRDEQSGTQESGPAEPMTQAPAPPRPPIADDMHYARYGRSIFLGMLLLIVGIGGFLAWATLAPISSGVVASGVVKVQGERKTVQHLEGGIIKELLVGEGDEVEEGQVLLRLDGSQAQAVLEVQSSEYLTLLAKKSRLQSERQKLDEIKFAQPLLDKADDPDVAALMASERSVFTDRKTSFEDQLRIFESWAEGYRREINGLEAQQKGAKTQLVHIRDELNAIESLYKKGVVAKPRMLELKRTAAGLNGEVGSLTADIARTEQKIGEAELRTVSLQNERAEQVSNELATVENQIRRLKEQLPAQRDVVERLEIVAPRSGRVVNLHYHTAGGVISPSTPILDLVPEDGKLLVEAKVKPVDIDVLVPGMEAQITLTAYSTRNTPPVKGRLLQVSADSVDDPKTGESHYQAMVEIDSDALAGLEGVKLYPGMPASVQFVGGERTPIDYLLSPLEAGLRKSWLE